MGLKIDYSGYYFFILRFGFPTEIVASTRRGDVGMAHLKGDKPIVDLIAEQNASVGLTNFMRAALRNSNFYTCLVQPVIETVRTDPAALLVHEQEFSEGIDCADRLECFFCGLRKKNRPFTGVCLGVIHRFTYASFLQCLRLFPEIRKKNALGHDYQKSTLPATTQSGGYTRHTCKRCGYTCISDYTKPLSPPADTPKVPSPENQSVTGRTIKSESAAPVITIPESSEGIVLARAPALKKIKRKGKSGFQVAWKKNRKPEKRILGYEIEVCDNAAFTGNVNHYTLKKGKYKKTIRGQRKKTYYVRIRYYCLGGYSWWSGTKKIRLK